MQTFQRLAHRIVSERPGWIIYLSWIAFTIGLVDGLAGIFDVPPFPRRLALTLLCLGAGVILLAAARPQLRPPALLDGRWVSGGLILAVTASLGWLTYRAWDSSESSNVYQVHVQSSTHGDALVYAEVRIELGGLPPLRAVTDADGIARFILEPQFVGKPGRLVIQAAHYATVMLNIDLKGSPSPFVVQMEPAELGP
jgi:hypothetical protein